MSDDEDDSSLVVEVAVDDGDDDDDCVEIVDEDIWLAVLRVRVGAMDVVGVLPGEAADNVMAEELSDEEGEELPDKEVVHSEPGREQTSSCNGFVLDSSGQPQ